jgi:hypothetical protein
MDRRRQRVAGAPGTLWTLANGVISRGGDIERVKSFAPTYSLPAGTFGMYRIRKQLYVFGSQSPPAMPSGVLYQQLAAPNSANMTRVLDVRSFSSKFYVIAEYDDGNLFHFYNGTRVTDWDTVADGNCDATTLADYLASKINNDAAVSATSAGTVVQIVANVAGTAFTISGAAVNKGSDNTQSITIATTQANVAAVAEVAATGSITITGGTATAGLNMITDVTVGATSLLSGGPSVNWAVNNATTAGALAAAINNQTARHGYTAAAVSAAITITAGPGVGATINGSTVTAVLSGNVTATTVNMAGGVTAVAPVAQICTATLGGLFESVDQYTITINGMNYVATGRASGTGIACLPSKNRIWSVAGTLLVGSALNTPNDFHTTTASSGFVAIDNSNVSEGNERLLGLAEYSAYLAVYSNNAIRLWSLNTDATQISFYKTIANTGTLASRAIVSLGSDDVFYLSGTGIRDLRPHDVVNVAFVNDIGTAIDPYVRSTVNSVNGVTLSQAVSVVEPIDGRVMMAIGGTIFVLSLFASSKINAWSYFNPGFQVTDWTVIGTQLYARSGNTIYLYGGTQGTTYADATVLTTAETPFLSANTPPNEKLIIDFDMASSGVWTIQLLTDPNDETKIITVGTATKVTYSEPNMGAAGRTTHFALKLTCQSAGFASISSFAVTFQGENGK